MAVIYARYSSDKQKESSIDDQYRLCERWASEQGIEVTKRYSDKAISGLSTDRKGYNQMLTDAQNGEFSIIIIDDLSRLGRDQVHREQAIRRLEYQGIQIVGVSDGYNSKMSNITRKTLRSVKGLFDEIYIDDLASKTHRGLEGIAIKGRSAGGLTYGYTSIPITDTSPPPSPPVHQGSSNIIGWEKAINTDQAIWVNHIFKRTTEGATPRVIAGELNEKGIPGPRGGSWAASAINADQKRNVGMLINPLYIGQVIWNRSKWVKNPDTGRRKRIERPKDQWIITVKPELRIIDQELWDKVQSILKAKRQRSLAIQKKRGPTARTGQPGKFLFSGLLKCGDCGGNYTMINKTHFGCSRHKERGKAICKNTLKVRRDLLEEKLLRSIKTDLWNQAAINKFIKKTAQILKEKSKGSEKTALKKQYDQCQKEIDNIMMAIKAGVITTTTKMELVNSENQLEEIKKSMENINKTIHFSPKAAANNLRRMINDLEQTKNVPATREILKKLIGENIKLIPNGDHLVAEMPGKEYKISVVAGAGFEPTTFGL